MHLAIYPLLCSSDAPQQFKGLTGFLFIDDFGFLMRPGRIALIFRVALSFYGF